MLARLNARAVPADPDHADAAEADADDIEARFLRAASDLREMAEREPNGSAPLERFKSEATEDSWQDAQRLARLRVHLRANSLDVR